MIPSSLHYPQILTGMSEEIDHGALHWLSASPYYADLGSITTSHRHEFMITISLDAKSYKAFSGIRLIVVYEESKFPANAVIVQPSQTIGPRKYDNSGLSANIRYRDVLLRERETYLSSNHSDHSEGERLPLCSVVFQLIKPKMFAFDFLALRTDIHDLSLVPLRIAYDHVYRCSPANHSIITCLESSRLVAHNPNVSGIRGRNTLPIYSIRILPAFGDRSPPVHLPPEIVRCIVYHAIDNDRYNWRACLLSFGLVHSSWSHVLDIYFEELGSGSNCDLATAPSVMRSLQRNTERAHLIRCISDTSFRKEEYPDIGKHCAIETILKLASSVQDIRLSPSYCQSSLNVLSQLRKVRRCSLYVGRDENVSVVDVHTLVANWVYLWRLELYEWRSNDDAEHLFKDRPPIPCKLEVLVLKYGSLTGWQLLRFIPSTFCCLRELKLKKVEGLTNNDLFQLFSRTSSTLARLRIKECIISGPAEDEEFAFEAVLPKMSRLESAQIQGDMASSLAITRKCPLTLMSRGDMDTEVEFWSVPLSMQMSILTALEVSCWKSITLHCSDPWDTVLLDKIASVAERRGIICRVMEILDDNF